MTDLTVYREALDVRVTGRPAPQGSKRHGAAGQLREASGYLPAWRAAVKRAVYEQYRARGVEPGSLPLFRGPVAFGGTFWVSPDVRPDAPPDMDKLLRATWDALSAARVWEDDARVVEIVWCSKAHPLDGETTGAALMVRPA